ncbi:MAG: bifunctional phosphopantothenoylcysteine decarboxylase/phosphopantothenate--cysteine ligase CoaBC [Intrasporangium sp.]|uniref:bifunctional phosphopantothenoylcysteine decarboxylase/phosphopantothenate--cysteine ligase CoaBC n=1 Tax=Intrasporangium sp. TaxID=1925024 RepID=UPI002647C74B|nr:bifunctional phosphopantothenoylcysteine decarboxylase/phosphopantothenate--cysteine ligase CoaBC [Intrasporangium sp.]MDN5794144.1 bifunctional phosphopantothenoylcysteine decarboxylase/phosphopantothenate--cysteine ligase CoaBC [Intrasporangium sp.]
MRVVVGVGGGIAAYKACSLVRRFTETGHEVTVVPTEAALRFVGAPTWAALSGRPVSTDVWTDVHQVPHVRIGQSADLVVVVPATADLLAKAAAGIADDLLTNTLLTARCPVVFAPAMHTEMWEHPATQANVETLRRRGAHVIDPAEGRLTGADSGKGRLPEPEQVYAAALGAVGEGVADPAQTGDAPGASMAAYGHKSLTGRTVVVSAGGTREPLDPVRYLGNRSSGKQGLAIAEVASQRGARVVLVAANVSLPTPPGVTVVRVETTLELKDAVETAARDADAVIMAAAPADFRPVSASASKIKKGADPDAGLRLDLVENPDIVRGLVARRDGARRPVIVSFAAETGDATGSVMDHAVAKFARKGSDLQVVNEVGRDKAFGRDDNTVHLLRRDVPEVVSVGPASKDVVAAAVLDVVEELLT